MQTANSAKTRSRSVEKRQQIFDAAAKLFTKQGFNGTSMDQIAQLAGVSKQTVYSHFGGKEGLFIAAVRHECVVNALDSSFINSNYPPEILLLKLAENFTNLLLKSGTVRVMRTCIGGAEQYPDVSEMFYEASAQPLAGLLVHYLDKQVAKGIFAIANTDHAANQFISMIQSDATFRALLGLKQRQNREELTDYIQSSVDMFVRAYRK